MFKSSIVAALGAAVALATLAFQPVQAQDGYAAPSTPQTQEAPQATQGTEGQGRQRRSNRNSQPAPPTPEQMMAAAQAIATTAGVACQVTQANLLGITAEQFATYEATCATGPGYILINSTPPQAVDCVLLAGQAEIDRMRDPAFVVGTQCVIPQNSDVLRVMTAYAAEAGVACPVDRGASIGKSSAGNYIYEVGCNGVDGYWLEREAAGWKKTECATILTQGATCRYSTVAEQAATLKSRLAANAEAAACDVSESRYMGANPNGSFYEAKCAAGNGMIVRFDTAFVVQQVYPCESAQRIGGGCTLTVVAALPETATPPAPQ